MTDMDIALLAQQYGLVTTCEPAVVDDLRKRLVAKDPDVVAFAKLCPGLAPPQELPKRRPRSRIVTRHCLYHVCPLAANDHWQTNVRQLLKRRHAFNGRCVAAIAQGDGCLPVSEVVRAFRGSQFEFIIMPNDPVLREVVSFLPLLLHVSHDTGPSATFYAHTKGNSTADGELGAQYWRNAAYINLLDRWPEAISALRSDYDCAGIHKFWWGAKCAPPYPNGFAVGSWTFAGTFFWLRNDCVFTTTNWRRIVMDRYGAEAWVSTVIADPRRGLSMFQLCSQDEGGCWNFNPYDWRLYPEEVHADDI